MEEVEEVEEGSDHEGFLESIGKRGPSSHGMGAGHQRIPKAASLQVVAVEEEEDCLPEEGDCRQW